ncbi:MAG: cache domain-containing protein [Treponemataceae bacterium]
MSGIKTVGRFGGINVKFTFLILLATVFFLVATYYVNFGMLRSFALQTAEEAAQTILDGSDSRIRSIFENLESLTRGLASTRAVKTANPAEMQDLFLSSVLAWKQYARAIYLGTGEGRMYEWGQGPEFINNMPTFPPDYDPRLRPWYDSALRSKGFAVSPPYRYASVNAMGISCVIKVYGDDGKFVGVLGIDILLDNIKTILTDLNIPKRGRAFILSENGEIITGKHETEGTKAFPLMKSEILNLQSHLTKKEGKFRVGFDGEDSLVYYRRSEPIGWYLLVALPYDAVMFSVRQTLSLISVVEVLMMALLTIALSIISNRLISSPLHKMVTVINRIEAGERNARISIRSNDEFALLGREFNNLVDTVEEYSSSLESKVKERTEKLRALQRENMRLRVNKERQRIYRDMHDSLGAQLTNIFFCNNVARNAVARNPEKLEGLFNDIESNCTKAVQDLKEIISGMKPAKDDEEHFIESLIDSIGNRLSNKRVSFSSKNRAPEIDSELSPEMKSELRKVFDELISNVLKHSDAEKTSLSIAIEETLLTFRFKDNGKGFDPQNISTGGSGLSNMEYRVKRLGGDLTIKTKRAKGTEFTIRVPIGKSENRVPV